MILPTTELAALTRARTYKQMVTPTAVLEVEVGGRREVLKPGRDRMHISHDLVRQRPDLFKVVDATDTRTRSELSRMASRGGVVHRRQPTASPLLNAYGRRPSRTTGKSWQLGSTGGRKSWQLA